MSSQRFLHPSVRLSTRLAANFLQNTVLFHLNPASSYPCALFFPTEHSQSLLFQSLPHSFPCHGGYPLFCLCVRITAFRPIAAARPLV
jgi:hypothetical protein